MLEDKKKKKQGRFTANWNNQQKHQSTFLLADMFVIFLQVRRGFLLFVLFLLSLGDIGPRFLLRDFLQHEEDHVCFHLMRKISLSHKHEMLIFVNWCFLSATSTNAFLDPVLTVRRGLPCGNSLLDWYLHWGVTQLRNNWLPPNHSHLGGKLCQKKTMSPSAWWRQTVTNFFWSRFFVFCCRWGRDSPIGKTACNLRFVYFVDTVQCDINFHKLVWLVPPCEEK